MQILDGLERLQGTLSPVRGLSIRRTDKGIPVIKVEVWADPTMNDQKLSWLRSRYTSDALWRQEVLIDYEARSGALVYPEFDESIHVVPHSRIPLRGTRFMSIDPHPRTPHAFLWVLIDQWSDWWIYRELWPSMAYGTGKQVTDSDQEKQYTIKEYAETIAYCERNEIHIERGLTDREYGKYIRKYGGEYIVTRFMDQAGKGFKASDEASLLESYAKRYAKYGIRCADPKKSHESGEDAIHALLKPRQHDTYGQWPRLHISDRCPELIWELRNHRFQITHTLSPDKDLKQAVSKQRCHMADNLRYLATSSARFIPRLVS